MAAIIVPIFSAIMSLFRDPAQEAYEQKASELSETMKENNKESKETVQFTVELKVFCWLGGVFASVCASVFAFLVRCFHGGENL